METRARYLLVGAFLLAAICAGFGFVYWLNNANSFGARAVYRVQFQGPAFGLIEGSSVLFNGIKVGEVTQLQLNAAIPGEVVAVIAVHVDTPVTAGTTVGLESLGLMGTPAVSLIGGPAGAPLLKQADGSEPTLIAPPDAGLDTMRAARQAIMRIDKLVADNSASLRNTIQNIESFASALGRNSGKVDTIAEGLSGMFGGQKKEASIAFDLSPADAVPSPGNMPTVQLAVLEPSSVLALDSQKISSQIDGKATAVFPDAQWSDNLPKLVQSRIVQSFENAGFMNAEEGEDNFDAEAKLLIDIRSFYVMPGSGGVDIEISAKVVVDGKVAGAKTFRQTRNANVTDANSVIAAFDDGFKATASELVVWTLGVL